MYFGGEGPLLPSKFRGSGELNFVCSGRNHRKEGESIIIDSFEKWIEDLDVQGVCGLPFDWMSQSQDKAPCRKIPACA